MMLPMPMSHEEAQEIARAGTSRWAYLLIKAILTPLFRLVFLMRVSGEENIPKTGPVVIAPNHKSFWDAFFITAVMKRRVFYMGKSELFQGKAGRLLLALGGFPVRRGASDAEAIETAMTILRRGDILALFPEGTRVADPLSLGTPKKGCRPDRHRDRRPDHPDRDHRHREAPLAAPAPGPGRLRRADPGRGPHRHAGGRRRIDRPSRVADDHRGLPPAQGPPRTHRRGRRRGRPGCRRAQDAQPELTCGRLGAARSQQAVLADL